MIGAGQGLDAFAAAISLALRDSRARPFAAFRGGYRRPVKPGRGGAGSADGRRLLAMALPPDRSSNIAKLQRGLRILARLHAANPTAPFAPPALRYHDAPTAVAVAPQVAPATASKLTDAQCREAVAARRAHDSEVKAAESLALSRNAFRNRLKRAAERGLS